MPNQVVLLDRSTIVAYLDDALSQHMYELYVQDTLPSTNEFLLARSQESQHGVQVCLSRHQTAGRGRNGRDWYSPASSNIYMSVGYLFRQFHAHKLGCLSVAIGVAVCHMLKSMGIDAGLKWPNDILVNKAKLAGVLVESKVAKDAVYVVIGVGLNVDMPAEAALNIDQSWTDLARCLPENAERPDINNLSAQLIKIIVDACLQYEQDGFVPFRDKWQSLEVLRGQLVTVCADEGEFPAEVIGIDQDCGLRIKANDTERTVYAGDIKLKL